MRGGLFDVVRGAVGRNRSAASRRDRPSAQLGDRRVARRHGAAAEQADRRLLIGGERQRRGIVGHRAGDQARVVAPRERRPRAERLGEDVLQVGRLLELLIVVDAEVAFGLLRVSMPPVPGGEKIALVWPITVNALKPRCSTRLMRPVKPSIFEWSHDTGKKIGVSNSTPKS